ncbi:unnamed protein product [Microthlaspi erraticum]|uniref:DUF1985 domain-containing protein n=1 Tax=Microthlaspi erraticum TaxID=1685480 RepID=A0A6D2JE75_9BRAS|nr:unnamed protein product [Microthlaspi erraticum]
MVGGRTKSNRGRKKPPQAPAPPSGRTLRSNSRIVEQVQQVEEVQEAVSISTDYDVGADGVAEDAGVLLREKLPRRLFPVHCYPSGINRLNIYAKAHVIGEVVAALTCKEELEQLKETQFGGLLNLHVGRCQNSAKLIHGLLGRQLVTKKKHELWTVFGGNPIRFSLVEFKRVTGLKCGKFPRSEDDEEGTGQPQTKPGEMSKMWTDLFNRKDSSVTVDDAIAMLKAPDVAEWKRLPLALIILVDGVLLCRDKALYITPAYVDILCDIEYFLDYPWGRESYVMTISRFIPLPHEFLDGDEDPLDEMRARLRQQTSACFGFPLALQLFAFEAIPMLVRQIPQPEKTDTFLTDPSACEKTQTILYLNSIVEVEEDPEVCLYYPNNSLIISFKEYVRNEAKKELEWDDEVVDEQVEMLIKLKREGHKFSHSDFQGCEASGNVEEPRAGDDERAEATEQGKGPRKQGPAARKRSKKAQRKGVGRKKDNSKARNLRK